MSKVEVELGVKWKKFVSGPLPYGATIVGVVAHDGVQGALAKTSLGWFRLTGKEIHTLPQRLVQVEVAKELANSIEKIPQVTGAKGGRAGSGKSKVRGNADHYRWMTTKRKATKAVDNGGAR